MTLAARVNQLVYVIHVSLRGSGGERNAEQSEARQSDKSGRFLRIHVNLLAAIRNPPTIIFLASHSRKLFDSRDQKTLLFQSSKIMLLAQKACQRLICGKD
jgi:hypothetical protein